MELLVFRLYAPLVSWGEVAVGEIRPSATRPTRSAVLGLVAAALGLDRNDDEAHAELSNSLGVAIRVDAPGTAVVDYHTVNWRRAKREVILTRSDELRAPRDELSTVQSYRHYRCDALATVGLWARAAGRWALADLAEVLDRPVFPLYLGRKACPPALPLAPSVIDAATLVVGFGAYDANAGEPSKRLRKRLSNGASLTLAWDAQPDVVAKGLVMELHEHRDDPLSRRRRRFSIRREAVATVPNDLIKPQEKTDVPDSPSAL